MQFQHLFHAGGAHRVSEANQSTASIDGDRAADLDIAVADHMSALARLGEAYRLEHQHLGDRETVMDFGHLDVTRRQPSGGVGPLCRALGCAESKRIGVFGERASRHLASQQFGAILHRGGRCAPTPPWNR